MKESDLKPEKINSPIQLMAAWFVMLVSLSGVLLTAAANINEPKWAAGFIVISTVVFIFIILVFVFLMLTKYRPNLQEGKEYAQWLKDTNAYTMRLETSIGDNQNYKIYINSLKRGVSKSINNLKEHYVNENDVKIVNKVENALLYNVLIGRGPDQQKMLDEMSKIGVQASIYESFTQSDEGEKEAIWLGSRVPPSVASSVIKQAVSLWPHLKYIHLSSDSPGPEETHWEIFLGGSTNTAVDTYHLTPWTRDELLSFNPVSMDELHSFVRSKYPSV